MLYLFTYFVVIHRKVPLLLFKLGHQSFGLLFDCHILLKEAVLRLQLLVILTWGCKKITYLQQEKYLKNHLKCYCLN